LERTAPSVIARSSCDEAIQSCFFALDCFAALAMTDGGHGCHEKEFKRCLKKIFSRQNAF
jgi:hypothetical protein